MDSIRKQEQLQDLEEDLKTLKILVSSTFDSTYSNPIFAFYTLPKGKPFTWKICTMLQSLHWRQKVKINERFQIFTSINRHIIGRFINI